MKLDDVGETIAMRKLSLLRDDGTTSEVLVLLGMPRQSPGYPDCYCPYQIKGAGSETVRYMCGIDAFQALQLAIRALAADLEVLNEHLGGNLRWEGDEKGWLGFPDRPDCNP
jgi:predicted alpha/beta-hydrolase family hydrolase